MSAQQGFQTNAACEQELVSLLNAAFPVGALPPPPDAFTPAQWQQLAERAEWHGLQNMLLRAIEILERADVPPTIFESLRDTFRRSALAQALCYRELEAVLELCARENISFVVLKGAALAKKLYPDSHLRAFGDLDVLIRRADAARTRELLLARGLREYEMLHGFNPHYYGEMAFFAANAQGAMIDLHWELVVSAYYQRRINLEWFWKHTESFSLGAQTALTFDATAQLIHLAAHVGLHHQDHERLIWHYDLALLIQKRGAEIEWNAADSFARQSGLARPLRATLDKTRARWGIPLPRATDALFHPSPYAFTERAVYAITTARFPEARALSDALSTPGALHKFQYIGKHLFPDAAYMRTHYRVRNDALLPFYYARRLVTSAFKFTRSLWAAATRG